MNEAKGSQSSKPFNTFSSDSYISWQEYKQMRPQYPPEVYKILAEYMTRNNHTDRSLCIDYGSGNGTVVSDIVEYCGVHKVLATDRNSRQLEEAKTALLPVYGEERFQTLVGAAGELDSIPDGSVDLAVAATACHWFDRPKWFREVARVLKPSGTLAFWMYQPQCYIVSHPEAAPACNEAFKQLFNITRSRAQMTPDQILVSTTLFDSVVVDPKLFSNQVRYQWWMPKAVSERLDSDAMFVYDNVSYPAEKTKAGVLATPGAEIFVHVPEAAGDVLVRQVKWTTGTIEKYMNTLTSPPKEAFEQEGFIQSLQAIHSVVGAPDGTFDVGWPFGLVLATRK